jgi:hypothetical protein
VPLGQALAGYGTVVSTSGNAGRKPVWPLVQRADVLLAVSPR